MMQQGKDYYNKAMDLVSLPLEESPWKYSYESAAAFIDPADTVLEIACGTGRFAKKLQLKGHASENYFGIDFSDVRIKEAKRYVPDFVFKATDAFDLDQLLYVRLGWFDTFVALEFLEHIENDLEFLDLVPKDSKIIASVPNFNTVDHVRYFPALSSVIGRYGKTIKIERTITRQIMDKPRFKVFLIKGIKC